MGPQITWCAYSSHHYIVESSVRYSMPLYLALQLKDYLKRCMRNNDDCVARWVSDLTPADRIFVQISGAAN
ncbi:MAG TPA: hypothetical protein VD996_03845 [Chitinophagaceae bacterium]|nr:hypothetical protein [Chitinophagaceae bacterium]